MGRSAVATIVGILALLLVGAAGAQGGGEQIYQQNCAVCHGNRGQGASGPALAGNTLLQDATFVVRQILNGGQAMPPFGGRLNDEQIAAVATHIRTNWGNSLPAIAAEQVAQVREGGTIEEEVAQQAPPAQPAGQAEQPEQAQEQAAAGQAAPTEVAIGVATASDGASYLVGADGRTLYRFLTDAPQGTSHCYEPCSRNWVPVTTTDTPQAGEGLEDSGALGMVERNDQTQQATYRGWPLYYFAGDEQAGDMNGLEITDHFVPVPPDVEGIGGEGGERAGPG